MSEHKVTRRDTLVVLGGAAAAQDPHSHPVAAEKKAAGPYKPKVFNEHDYQTLVRLCGLILPADGVSASALEAGAPEYIDLLCAGNGRLREMYLGGLAWLDRLSEKRTGKSFVESPGEEQGAMLDLLAYRKNESAELKAGIRFFDWVRRMTVDAFYTSPVGIKDIGYRGNRGMTEFKVPQEAIDHVLKRSPV